MPFPLIPMMIAMAAGGAASSVGSNMAANRRQKQQGDADAAAQLQNVALEESSMDPFRHQMSQANAINALDYLEHWQPFEAPEEMRQFVPTGGYTPSPQARASASVLKGNIMRGQGMAPTMTNPANYGQTGVSNLLPQMQAPSSLPAQSAMPAVSYNDLLDQPTDPRVGRSVQRRVRQRFQPRQSTLV